jgi:flagellar protein FlaG
MVPTIGKAGAPAMPAPIVLPAAPQGPTPQPAAVVSAATPLRVAERQLQLDQVQKAMEAVKRSIETKTPNAFRFSIDEATGKTIVTITDAKTGETIRQIPSEEILEIARSLERMQSLRSMLLQQWA